MPGRRQSMQFHIQDPSRGWDHRRRERSETCNPDRLGDTTGPYSHNDPHSHSAARPDKSPSTALQCICRSHIHVSGSSRVAVQDRTKEVTAHLHQYPNRFGTALSNKRRGGWSTTQFNRRSNSIHHSAVASSSTVLCHCPIDALTSPRTNHKQVRKQRNSFVYRPHSYESCERMEASNPLGLRTTETTEGF